MPLLAAVLLYVLCSSVLLHAAPSAQQAWITELSSDGSLVEPRSESGAVEIGGKLYVLGGRGAHLGVNRYDPVTRSWTSLGAAPEELHHFQPVAIGKYIYVIGALTGRHPDEPSVSSVYRLDTDTAEWSVVGTIPANRLRGSTTAVLYDGDIYVSGGNTLGHSGGAVAWFDKFDVATGNWTILADAPNERDHASGVVIGNKLYVAGGRTTDLPNPFDKPVLPVDIYDFETAQWASGMDIPTVRAGATNVAVDNELIVAGGEITGVDSALAHVEAYNTVTDRWRRLADMKTGRHGGSGAIIGERLHVVAGSRIRGGENTSIHESLILTGSAVIDTDADGLDDESEVQTHGTNPDSADTDEDGLEDGEEIARETDPLVVDSDNDGLRDGEEVAIHGTDPLRVDTDSDGLSDGEEVGIYGTDPLLTDTDSDGRSDSHEIGTGTDPLVANEGGSDSGSDADSGGADSGSGSDGGVSDEGGSDNAETPQTDTGDTDSDTDNEGSASSSERESVFGSGFAGMPMLTLLVLVSAIRRRLLGACPRITIEARV